MGAGVQKGLRVQESKHGHSSCLLCKNGEEHSSSTLAPHYNAVSAIKLPLMLISLWFYTFYIFLDRSGIQIHVDTWTCRSYWVP